jgi:hypothetical protein
MTDSTLWGSAAAFAAIGVCICLILWDVRRRRDRAAVRHRIAEAAAGVPSPRLVVAVADGPHRPAMPSARGATASRAA